MNKFMFEVQDLTHSEHISMIAGKSFILSFASTIAAATSPMYFVRFREFISFMMASFWTSEKLFIFLTNAVFFFSDESSLWKNESSKKLAILYTTKPFNDRFTITSKISRYWNKVQLIFTWSAIYILIRGSQSSLPIVPLFQVIQKLIQNCLDINFTLLIDYTNLQSIPGSHQLRLLCILLFDNRRSFAWFRLSCGHLNNQLKL